MDGRILWTHSGTAPTLGDDIGADGAGHAPARRKAGGTLASFLTAKNAKGNKTRKFLATTLWLQDAEGKSRVSTGDVTKALSHNSQGSVGSNPSQCLVQNVKQGFIAKEGRQFYVTDEGRTELG